MKPVFRRDDDIKGKLDEVEQRIKVRIKTEVEDKVKSVLKEKEDADKAEKDRKDKSDKIAKAVDVARTIKGGGQGGGGQGGGQVVDGKMVAEDVMSCPTCHGHKLQTDKSGLTVKCSGPGCGKEYVLIDKTADYKCVGCGAALKKPKDDVLAKEMDGCPFCRSTKAIRYDWSKLWDRDKKKGG